MVDSIEIFDSGAYGALCDAAQGPSAISRPVDFDKRRLALAFEPERAMTEIGRGRHN